MSENSNHKNFLLKNALNTKAKQEITIDPNEEEAIVEPLETDSSESQIIDSEEELFEEDMFEGFDEEEHEQVEETPEEQTVGSPHKKDIGLEELSDDVISIQIPDQILNIPEKELNDQLDYKRLEDRVTNLSSRLSRLQEAVEGFNKTLGNIHETLPQTIVKEADDRITKHLNDNIETNIKNNFGNLKEHLANSMRVLVAQGGVTNQCISALCNYINLLMIKNKITEMQLAMAKGKTFNESSKKQLEAKLKAAHQATRQIPLRGIIQMAQSLGDGRLNNGGNPQINGNR